MYARMFSIPGNEMMIPTYIFLYGSTEDGNANVALPHCLKAAVPSHARCPVGHLFSPTFLTSMRNGHTTDNHWTHGWIFPLSCQQTRTAANSHISAGFPHELSSHKCWKSRARHRAQTCHRRHPHLVRSWVIAKMGSCSRTGGSAIESNDLSSHLGGWVCNGLCITMYNQCYWKQFNFKNTWEDGFVMVYESLCITSILKPFTGWCFIHILHLSIPEIGMMIPNH